jgi:uncharacterized protein YifN (PemK superfamily)
MVEGQTGHSAEQQGNGVDDMGAEIENFSVFNRRHVENIFDVGEMSSRTQLDELDAQANEYYQANLTDLSDFLTMLQQWGGIDIRDGVGELRRKKRRRTYP